MTKREIYYNAIERVKRGWTQGAASRGPSGLTTNPTNSEAVCWCLTGAIDAEPQATGGEKVGAMIKLDALARKAGYESAVEFNDFDTTTKQDVLELLEKAVDGN